jgi:transposase InsO family protein
VESLPTGSVQSWLVVAAVGLGRVVLLVLVDVFGRVRRHKRKGASASFTAAPPTGDINSSDIRDLMIESVERRFGLVSRAPNPIEWVSDNGSPYIAGETRSLARDLGLVPCTTPIESLQSNGMAEAFVKLIKRDYARVNPRPDAASVLRELDS